MERRAASRRAAALVLLFLVAFVFPHPAHALRDDLESEEALSDLLFEPTAAQAEREEMVEMTAPDAMLEEAEEKPSERTWAVLPQLGFGPETGFLFGGKFIDRDLFASDLTLDLDGVFAIEGQAFAEASLASPTLFGLDIPILVAAEFNLDPVRRFFGLGNNQQGPDPASSHEMQDFGGEVTIGWRLIKDLSLNLQAGGYQIDLHGGDKVDDLPSTLSRFPDLPGIKGGVIVPIAASLVYNDRGDLTRPTRGWRVIAKAIHTNSALGSDFEYSNFLLDAGYLYPLFNEWLILGARVGGEYILGDFDKIPFWDLAVLGSEDTLRGYFPYRFLGTSRLWMNAEARAHLFDVDIFDWWRLKVDGVGFTDFGRVFLDDDDLVFEGPVEGGLVTNNDLQVSYGGGLRLAFSEALVARLDVAFSNEETGLVYFTFGHLF